MQDASSHGATLGQVARRGRQTPAGDYLLGTRLDDGDLVYYYPLKIQ
ncbi:MAG TPA: hypothetical protein VFB14_27910 [Bryobacteraceae bacterium]|nr:hypothetical protein [Bryobacteraceae bacterium]